MYYIIENQLRPDGVVNNTTTSRMNYENALSYFYERASKMLVTTLFQVVYLMLVDTELNIIKYEAISTKYDSQTDTLSTTE